MTSKVYDFYNELTRLTEFEVKKLDPDSLKNGIAVRVPNWLGDACMALPALMQLKKIIPEHCGLFVICPPAVSAIFKSMPIVDAVAELHEPHTGWNDEDRKAVMQFRAGAAFLFNNSQNLYFFLFELSSLFKYSTILSVSLDNIGSLVS